MYFLHQQRFGENGSVSLAFVVLFHLLAAYALVTKYQYLQLFNFLATSDLHICIMYFLDQQRFGENGSVSLALVVLFLVLACAL